MPKTSNITRNFTGRGVGVVGSIIFSVAISLPSTTFAERFRYIDEAGNILWADSIYAVPPQFRHQVLRPTAVPDAATQKWLDQRRREKEQAKLKKEQEEERKRRDEERRREQLRRERERELKKQQKG